jgi:hypothetical protein
LVEAELVGDAHLLKPFEGARLARKLSQARLWDRYFAAENEVFLLGSSYLDFVLP